MSLFDDLSWKCPYCKEEFYEQSKSGPCFMNNYTLENCPSSILEDLFYKKRTCNKCNKSHMIVPQIIIKGLIVGLDD